MKPKHSYIRTCIHTYIHTYICIFASLMLRYHEAKPLIHTHAYMHAYIHTFMHTYMCIFARPGSGYGTMKPKHLYIHTCIHTYIHAYIHTYIHMHICSSRLRLRYHEAKALIMIKDWKRLREWDELLRAMANGKVCT